MNKNRWYDKHEDLADHLEALKILPQQQLSELLKDLIAFAELLHPSLFDEHLLEYPLDPKKRRWYDEDPYLWLVVNGLRYAEDSLIKKVVAFFDKQITARRRVEGMKSAAKKPAAKKPAAKKPAAKKPAAKKPAAKKPAAKKPAAKKPAAKKPAAKKPAAKKPAAKKPAAKKPAAKKPAAKKPAAKKKK